MYIDSPHQGATFDQGAVIQCMSNTNIAPVIDAPPKKIGSMICTMYHLLIVGHWMEWQVPSICMERRT
jgi:hypothetical protein